MSERMRRCRLPCVAGLLLAALLGGCGAAELRTVAACGQRRLETAANLYTQAKDKLAVHFSQRVESALTEAYNASQDAVLVARATRSCADFDEVIRRQAIDLIKTNLLFQKLVVSNMRDQDPGVVIDLYGSRYREIFKTDIQ